MHSHHAAQRNKGEALITDQVRDQFLVATIRWGNDLHTLVYTGPQFTST